MAQPPAYNRAKDFTEDFGSETDHSALNAELDTASNSINGLRTNLAIIQADDGRLRQNVVTADSLTAELKAELSAGIYGDMQALVADAQLAAGQAEDQALLATSNGAAQVALATTQAELATSNGAAQVALAAAQVSLATEQAALATAQAGLAEDQATIATAQVALAAAQAASAEGSAADAAESAIAAASAAMSFPSGTKMLFVQSAAPTGWTKDTTHNDKALRVVSGDASFGGSTAFSTVMTSRTPTGSVDISGLSVGATTLTIAQIPSHEHALYSFDPDASYLPPENALSYEGSYTGTRTTLPAGGGGSHTHSLSGSGSVSFAAMDFAVQYVDVIIATKD